MENNAMFTGLITDLNQLEDWILKQEDLWLPEHKMFHRSHLYTRLTESNPPKNDLKKDQIIRCIALAEIVARRKMM